MNSRMKTLTIRPLLTRLARRRGGPSLMRMLAPLVLFAVATTILFAVANGDSPDDRAVPLLQRLRPTRLWAQTTDSVQ